MGDPLSVAASVVGLISLGIQVTKSLVKYYSLYRLQDSAIDSTTKKLNNLIGIFESFELTLSNRRF